MILLIGINIFGLRRIGYQKIFYNPLEKFFYYFIVQLESSYIVIIKHKSNAAAIIQKDTQVYCYAVLYAEVSILVTEATAVRETIKKAIQLKMDNFIMKSDSQVVTIQTKLRLLVIFQILFLILLLWAKF